MNDVVRSVMNSIARHRTQLAEGLGRWADFAESCLEREGPAGVVNRGASEHLRSRRATAEAWQDAWGSNPMNLVGLLANSRQQVATSHARGIQHLLEHADSTVSTLALSRSLAETAARAAWLLDPDIDTSEAVCRALTELIHETYQLELLRKMPPPAGFERGPAETGVTIQQIVDFAQAVGFSVVRDRKGKVRAVGDPRPDTSALLTRLDADERALVPFGDMVLRLYRQSCAAVHGSTMAWATMVVAAPRGDTRMEMSALAMAAAHVMHALHLHLRAFDAWNRGLEWSPQDLLDGGRRASLAGFHLAYLQLLGFGSGGTAGSSTGPTRPDLDGT